MRNLPQMGLIMWDQLEDPYDHVQLANNFAKLDAHDHTPGRGTLLTSQSIEGEAITTALLAAESVTTPKIAKEAVTGEKIGAGGAKYEEGESGSRPAAGKKGRIWYSTDTKVYSLDNGSAWTQLVTQKGTNASYLSWGIISSAGAVKAGTGDFTSAKTSTGLYEVKWNSAKPSGDYAVVATPLSGLSRIAKINESTTTKFVVATMLPPAEAQDTQFSFVVMASA